MAKLFSVEFSKFILVAAFYNIVATLFNWLLLYCGINYILANALSYILGVVIAYLLNTKIVFKKVYNFKEFVKFISVYLSNFVLTLIMVFILVDWLKVNAYAAPIITTGLSAGYNYFLSKYFVYHKD